MKLGMLFNFCFENPLKTWWKARKYFVKPKSSFNWFSDIYYNCPFARIDYAGKILTIWSRDVQWKDKYDSPRHEGSPYIWVCFFRKFGFSINWHITYDDEKYSGYENHIGNGDMYYWEYILDYLYYSKDLNNVAVWTGTNKKTCEKYRVPIEEFSLNKKGKILLIDNKYSKL